MCCVFSGLRAVYSRQNFVGGGIPTQVRGYSGLKLCVPCSFFNPNDEVCMSMTRDDINIVLTTIQIQHNGIRTKNGRTGHILYMMVIMFPPIAT